MYRLGQPAHIRVFCITLCRLWQIVCVWCFGLKSLCEVMSTVLAGAIECRRCFQERRSSTGRGVDKRKQLNIVPKRRNLMGSRTIHPHGTATPQTVEKAMNMFYSLHLSPSHSLYCLLVGAPRWLCLTTRHGPIGSTLARLRRSSTC